MLDKQGFKPLNALKFNWFSHFRLKTPLEKFSSRNDLTLTSTVVSLPSVRTGTTPTDHALPESTGGSLPSVKTGKTPLDHALLTSTGVTLPYVKTDKTPLDHTSLTSTGVTLPSKMGKTTLDYIS